MWNSFHSLTFLYLCFMSLKRDNKLCNATDSLAPLLSLRLSRSLLLPPSNPSFSVCLHDPGTARDLFSIEKKQKSRPSFVLISGLGPRYFIVRCRKLCEVNTCCDMHEYSCPSHWQVSPCLAVYVCLDENLLVGMCLILFIHSSHRYDRHCPPGVSGHMAAGLWS